ncbi:hypothetical protein FQA39_LY09418 [Lamprigera yunnana]|nr:hypothetical protein FQA39_LY09418 [Lamprigera yunnana]
MIVETKKFDEFVRILEPRDHCERDRERDGENKYNSSGHYNNYQHRKHNHGGQGKNNHNYFQRPCQRNPFYLYNKNRNNRTGGRNVNINQIIQQPTKDEDRIEGLENHQDADSVSSQRACEFSMVKGKVSGKMSIVPEMSVEVIIGINILNQYNMEIDLKKKCVKWKKFLKYFVGGNIEDEVPKKHVGNEMNINNVNIGRDVKNNTAYDRDGIREKICHLKNIV